MILDCTDAIEPYTIDCRGRGCRALLRQRCCAEVYPSTTTRCPGAPNFSCVPVWPDELAAQKQAAVVAVVVVVAL